MAQSATNTRSNRGKYKNPARGSLQHKRKHKRKHIGVRGSAKRKTKKELRTQAYQIKRGSVSGT
jgi:hypothetical protein